MGLKRLLLVPGIILGVAVHAQNIVRVGFDDLPIVCYADPHSHRPTRMESPKLRSSSGARIKTANIQVDYFGFSTAARNSFEEAVAIWEGLITSPVPIRVAAVWSNLPAGVLGAAGPGFWASNFKGAPALNVHYPGALAEKLANAELNESDEYEIIAQFNSSANWHFPPTGTPEAGQHDFITVVLHELGHGLGFTSTFGFRGGEGLVGDYTDGLPFPYDLAVETGLGVNLVQGFNSPSNNLAIALTSNNLVIKDATLGLSARIYAPSVYDDGSSISHLDAATFPQGTSNSLMRPFVNSQEVNHDPGPIARSIFTQMGWVTTYIDHDHLVDREDSSEPIEITATIRADGTDGYSFNPEQVVVTYSFQGQPSNEVAMLPTGQADEFKAVIPALNSAGTFSYFISVGDQLGRTITSPGKQYQPLSHVPDKGPFEARYSFSIGPDTSVPVITHTPHTFISYQDDELVIEAVVQESSGIAQASVQYYLNDDPATTEALELQHSEKDYLNGYTLYTYRTVIPFSQGSLIDGDVFHYRLVFTDGSLQGSTAFSPALDYHNIPVKGLVPVQSYYINSFNVPSDDFIGTNFSITTPSGFDDPAIHSEHPYAEAGEGNTLNFTYQLRIPIVVTNGTMEFDEIVIVEPGESGVPFGSDDFFDYVIVEGQRVGENTWVPLLDGYDSRVDAGWNSIYENELSPNKSHFRKRKLLLTDTFDPGDEIIIRFRLYSDPFASGWGWAIDNLRIQTDNEPPVILHNHVDLVKEGQESVSIPISISDDYKLNAIVISSRLNDGILNEESVELSGREAIVQFSLDVSGLTNGDVMYYRYTATDSAGNVSVMPPSSELFKVEVQSFAEEVSSYANDFDSQANDFSGNFFELVTPQGFSSQMIRIGSPYLAGFGYGNTSDFSLTFEKKIIVNESNPYIQFDEVAIVELHDTGAAFGSGNFRDYVILEASKDDGASWLPLLDGYDATVDTRWRTHFLNGTAPAQSNLKRRTINLLESGQFVPGDKILLRFRLFSDASGTGWGWAIDNLHIQDVVTHIAFVDGDIRLTPNPTSQKSATLEWSGTAPSAVQVLNLMGQPVSEYSHEALKGPSLRLSMQDLPAGVYLVKVIRGGQLAVMRLVVD